MPNNKQRREAARRRLERQQQRRAQRAASRRRVTLIVSVVATLALVGLVVTIIVATTGNDSHPQAGSPGTSHPPTHPATAPLTTPTSPTPPTTSPTTASSSPTAPGTCVFTKSGKAARPVKLPPTHVPHKGTANAVVTTNRGSMTFTLDEFAAPCASASFLSLAKQHYFDNTPCHRLTTAGIFVLQCGDPTGTGTGGPGYRFADELTGKEKYTRGVLAMANSGADTNGSQFFIVYKDSTLGPNYTIFGHVTKGLGVVDAVAAKGVQGGGSDGKPALPISLTSVTPARSKS